MQPLILMIEDNPADIRLFREALDYQGEAYSLIVLRDGEEALRFVDQQRLEPNPKPCVVVLDLHLPRYDGMTVLRALRKEPVLSHIKVAVITTLASPDEEAGLLQLGVELYRTKPRNFSDVLTLGAEILALCKAHLTAIAVS